MEINNNIQLNQSNYTKQSSKKIAKGRSINGSSSDSPSLAISKNLQLRNSELPQPIKKANNALASLQIGHKALDEQSNILDKIKENLLQISTNGTSNREAIFNNIQNLLKDFNGIASRTNYNTNTLLQSGSNNQNGTNKQEYQVDENSQNTIELDSIQSNTLGVGLDGLLNQNISTFSPTTARSYLDNINNAIDKVNTYKSDITSTQDQLKSIVLNITSEYTQTRVNNSAVFETNFAQETSSFSKQNILAQAGAYASSQSNNVNQGVVARLLS